MVIGNRRGISILDFIFPINLEGKGEWKVVSVRVQAKGGCRGNGFTVIITTSAKLVEMRIEQRSFKGD